MCTDDVKLVLPAYMLLCFVVGATLLASVLTSSPATAREMTKTSFIEQCAAENSLGSKPACQCLWPKINAFYTGEERKLMTSFYTTSFADWTTPNLTEARQDALLDESLALTRTCGIKIQP